MQDGTLKVAKIEDHRPATMATHTITYQLDGFAITTVIETATPIRQLVDKLKSIGAEPPTAAKPEPTKQNGEDAPVCEFHGAMKRSNHNGWFCPKKMGDGSYCKSKT